MDRNEDKKCLNGSPPNDSTEYYDAEKENNDKKELSCSSLLIRKALNPLMIAMKAAGQNCGSSCPRMKQIDIYHKVGKIYSIFVAILLAFALLRYIYILFMKRDTPLFLRLEYFLWYLKGFIQTVYCLSLCSRSTKGSLSKIQQLINDYDCTLNWFSSVNEKTQNRFMWKSRIVVFTSFIIVAINVVTLFITLFHTDAGDQVDIEIFVGPFPINVATKLFCAMITVYVNFAWVLPVPFYCLLCDSLSLIFDQFYDGIETAGRLEAKLHIFDVRKKYNHLIKLCEKTDNMLSFLAVCIYLFDIVLFCFNLYHLIYYAEHIVTKVMAGFWGGIALSHLLAISCSASVLVDKVSNDEK